MNMFARILLFWSQNKKKTVRPLKHLKSVKESILELIKVDS